MALVSNGRGASARASSAWACSTPIGSSMANLCRSAPTYKKHRDDRRTGQAHDGVVRLDQFGAPAAAAGVEATMLDDIGDPAEQILREAERCDLVLLGGAPLPGRNGRLGPSRRRADHSSSPAPVVIVPREFEDGESTRRGLRRRPANRRARCRHLLLLGLRRWRRDRRGRRAPDGAEAAAIAGLAAKSSPATARGIRLHPWERVTGPGSSDRGGRLFTSSVTRAVLQACPVPAVVGA